MFRAESAEEKRDAEGIKHPSPPFGLTTYPPRLDMREPAARKFLRVAVKGMHRMIRRQRGTGIIRVSGEWAHGKGPSVRRGTDSTIQIKACRTAGIFGA